MTYQCVTNGSFAVMNVIRMIKLFGWEPKVNEQIADKREEELVWVRRFKILELANGVTKCVFWEDS